MKTNANSDILSALLTREEGPTLDFKKDPYPLRGAHEKGEFIKDILAMANTPRDTESHIVMGVKKQQGQPPIVEGIPVHRDENDYQQIITSIIRPTPVVRYLPAEHNGHKIGILEIVPERTGPYRANSDIGPVRRNALYWRAGSTNTEIADPIDEAKVRAWHSHQVREATVHSADWTRFMDASKLGETERVLILAAGPLALDSLEAVGGLSEAPWFAVFDFDTASDERGMLSCIRPRLQSSRQIHEVILGEHHSVNVNFSTYWYFARGVISRANTVVEDKYTLWLRQYGRDINKQMQNFAEKTGLRPVSFVLTCEADDFSQRAPYFNKLIEAAVESFGERALFFVCTLAPSVEEGFRSYDSNVTTYALSPSDLARGLTYSLDGNRFGRDARAWELPARGGVVVQIEASKRPWLSEELEIVHQLVGIEETPDRFQSQGFLRGAQISWRQLALHDDVRRDVTEKILRNLRIDLGLTAQQSQGTLRYSLYHEPGAGGTTVARRLLWELKGEVPAAVLRSCTPVETVERIRYVHNATALPVLILVEGRDVSENILGDLYTLLRSQQIPCILVQVFRGFTMAASKEKGIARAHFLPSRLSNVEASLFGDKFSRAAPHRRKFISSLVSSTGDTRQPFFFGLFAFEDSFTGLPEFVRARLKSLTPEQTNLLVFMSIAYYYGHSALSAQIFARMLGIPLSQKVHLEKVLPEYARTLLIAEGEDWRPVHVLIAHEIIRQTLNPAGGDPRIWKQNLTHWAKLFADFCRSTVDAPSANIVDLVHRCFVNREAKSFVGKEESRSSGIYSRLLEDIPSQDDRLSLLKHLVDLFPEDAHLWAHLGRFVYRELKTKDAIDYINRSIDLSPDDPLLYHMKGMALRSFAYDLLDEWKKNRQESVLNEALSIIAEAGTQFERSRSGRSSSQDEHGYVSHIQMLLRLLDAAQVVYGSHEGGIADILAKRPDNLFFREALDTAEGLLELVRLMQEGERESEYVIRCAADLNALYGNYSSVLRAWDSLLTRQDVYKPSIRRQIIGTYLSRKGRRWADVSQEHIRRSVQLLEANMLEEPGEERNIRMWVQAVRRVMPPRAIENVVARVAYWKANSVSVDAAYYLYVLYSVMALEGSSAARLQAEDALSECKRRSRLQRNRSVSFEWLGKGTGMQRLVHQSEMGVWDSAKEFWKGADKLSRVVGRVASIRGPEAGELELQGGLFAFFVPGRAELAKGRDENVRVSLFLGFTYDGPRAWEVKKIGGGEED